MKLGRHRQEQPPATDQELRPTTVRYHRFVEKDVAALTVSIPTTCVAPPQPANHVGTQAYTATVETYLKEQGILWRLRPWVAEAEYRTRKGWAQRKLWTIWLMEFDDAVTATAIRKRFAEEMR